MGEKLPKISAKVVQKVLPMSYLKYNSGKFNARFLCNLTEQQGLQNKTNHQGENSLELSSISCRLVLSLDSKGTFRRSQYFVYLGT